MLEKVIDTVLLVISCGGTHRDLPHSQHIAVGSVVCEVPTMCSVPLPVLRCCICQHTVLLLPTLLVGLVPNSAIFFKGD